MQLWHIQMTAIIATADSLKNVQEDMNILSQDSYPMNLQLFTQESLVYHYDNLKEQYTGSNSTTRRKNLIIPKKQKENQ